VVNLFFKRRSENRARHPWGGFALTNDLELQQAPAEVRMTGHIESRRIVITGVQSRPESETARVTICVDLLAPLPEGFELVRMADPVAKSGGATSSDPLASYRRNWTVTGVDRDLAEDFLTPPRLAVMRQIERISRDAAVGIRDGAFYWIERLPLTNASDLADRVEKALMSARDLDSCRPPALAKRLLERQNDLQADASDADSAESGLESPSESWSTGE